jgi:hypothetical protein
MYSNKKKRHTIIGFKIVYKMPDLERLGVKYLAIFFVNVKVNNWVLMKLQFSGTWHCRLLNDYQRRSLFLGNRLSYHTVSAGNIHRYENLRRYVSFNKIFGIWEELKLNTDYEYPIIDEIFVKMTGTSPKIWTVYHTSKN